MFTFFWFIYNRTCFLWRLRNIRKSKCALIVTSYNKDLPWLQGINVMPSGLLPLFLDMPGGSVIGRVDSYTIATTKQAQLNLLTSYNITFLNINNIIKSIFKIKLDKCHMLKMIRSTECPDCMKQCFPTPLKHQNLTEPFSTSQLIFLEPRRCIRFMCDFCSTHKNFRQKILEFLSKDPRPFFSVERNV